MQSNRDIIAAIFDETAKGNGRPFADAMREDAQWRNIGSNLWSGTYAGKESILRDLFGSLRQRLAGQNVCVPTRIIADGDIVVVQANGQNRTKDGREYQNDYCFVIHMTDGMITKIEEYSDTQLIADVLGVGPRLAG
jgi:ketosteroid isomerase-like protein